MGCGQCHSSAIKAVFGTVFPQLDVRCILLSLMTQFHFPTFIYVKIFHLKILLNLTVSENLQVHKRSENNYRSKYRGLTFYLCKVFLCIHVCLPGRPLTWRPLLWGPGRLWPPADAEAHSGVEKCTWVAQTLAGARNRAAIASTSRHPCCMHSTRTRSPPLCGPEPLPASRAQCPEPRGPAVKGPIVMAGQQAKQSSPRAQSWTILASYVLRRVCSALYYTKWGG